MESISGNDNLSARVRRTLEDLASIRQSLLAISDQQGECDGRSGANT